MNTYAPEVEFDLISNDEIQTAVFNATQEVLTDVETAVSVDFDRVIPESLTLERGGLSLTVVEKSDGAPVQYTRARHTIDIDQERFDREQITVPITEAVKRQTGLDISHLDIDEADIGGGVRDTITTHVVGDSS